MATLLRRATWDASQDPWASVIEPAISCPILKGIQLKNITLTSGNNTINHKLQRAYQGYFITGMHNAYAQIYDLPSTNSTLTLVLHASAATSIDLWVY